VSLTQRFRWIEGGENYHFEYDEKTVRVTEMEKLTFSVRLSREELDVLMHRFLKNRERFVDGSGDIFLEYLTKRGIDLPR